MLFIVSFLSTLVLSWTFSEFFFIISDLDYNTEYEVIVVAVNNEEFKRHSRTWSVQTMPHGELHSSIFHMKNPILLKEISSNLKYSKLQKSITSTSYAIVR